MPKGNDGDRLKKQVRELRETNEELRERLEQHEAWLRKMMPGRRDILKMGGASAVTALGIGVAVQPGAAADTSQGAIGESGGSQDVYLDEIRDPGGDVVADVDDTGDIDWQSRGFDNLSSVSTDEIGIGNTRALTAVSTSPSSPGTLDNYIRTDGVSGSSGVAGVINVAATRSADGQYSGIYNLAALISPGDTTPSQAQENTNAGTMSVNADYNQETTGEVTIQVKADSSSGWGGALDKVVVGVVLTGDYGDLVDLT